AVGERRAEELRAAQALLRGRLELGGVGLVVGSVPFVADGGDRRPADGGLVHAAARTGSAGGDDPGGRIARRMGRRDGNGGGRAFGAGGGRHAGARVVQRGGRGE